MLLRTLVALACLGATACATTSSGPAPGGSPSAELFSETEAVAGIKEVLAVSTRQSAQTLSRPGGFAGDPFVRIPFPPEASFAEKTLRDLGMGPSIEKFVLQLNRAAEAATTAATPIFSKSIQSMSVSDAWGIITGEPDAATAYFKERSASELATAFRPIVAAKLKDHGVLALWQTMTTRYNKLPWTEEEMETDLASYTTTRAIDGLFVKLAANEKKIRTEPAAQSTELLRQVFGRVHGE